MANYQSNSASSGSSVKVKEERHDEAEIVEMAAKMLEAQKLAAAKTALQQQQQQVVRQLVAPSANQSNILNFLQRKPAATTATAMSNGGTENGSTNDNTEDAKPADDESIKGHFGWESFSGGKIHIPYIIRQSEKYCAVRIIEQKLLNKYLNYLHQDLYNCTCVRSYYITDAEARLLNEINTRHCDLLYGKDQFTTKDLIVRLTDAQKFSQFLDVCYKKLLMNCSTPNDKCGFIRINNESVVPYTVREGQKMVPLFYFEGETDNLKLKADSLSGWDLSYLKFCCKVQGIRNELFASDTVAVISLDDIKSYFPQGTVFEDYWPNKVVDSQLLLGGKSSQNSAVHWTRQPSHPPPKQMIAQQMTKTQANNQAQVRKIAGNPNLSQQQIYTNEVQQQYLRSMQSAAAANGLPQQGLTAAVQAMSNNWSNQQMNNSGLITQNQIDHVLRLTAAKSQQSQAAALRQYANNSGRNSQMQNILQNQLYNAYSNGMSSNNSSRSNAQQPPPLVRSSQTSQQAAAAHMSSGSGPSLLRSSGDTSSTLNPSTSASHTSRTNNNVVTITRCPPTQASFGSRVPASTTITPSSQSRYQNPSSLSIYPKSSAQSNGHMSILHSSSISPVIQSPTRASPQSSQAKQPISPASPMRNLHPQLLQHQIESLLNNKSLSNYSANDILKETLLLSQLAGQQFPPPASKQNSSNAMNLNYLNNHSNPSNQSNPINSYPNNFTGQRLKSVITSRAAQDVIDLSSPPRSSTQQAAAKRALNGNYMSQNQVSRASILQQQAAAAQAAQQHQMLQEQQNSRIIHLPEMPQNTHYGPPYKVQKTLVDNTMVTCINMAPYVHTDLLMPLSELRETFYPQINMDICRRVIQALEINLYKGNRMQYKAYVDIGKQISENIPLVQVRDIIQHIPQLNYMVRGHIQEAATATKRARIS